MGKIGHILSKNKSAHDFIITGDSMDSYFQTMQINPNTPQLEIQIMELLTNDTTQVMSSIYSQKEYLKPDDGILCKVNRKEVGYELFQKIQQGEFFLKNILILTALIPEVTVPIAVLYCHGERTLFDYCTLHDNPLSQKFKLSNLLLHSDATITYGFNKAVRTKEVLDTNSIPLTTIGKRKINVKDIEYISALAPYAKTILKRLRLHRFLNGRGSIIPKGFLDHKIGIPPNKKKLNDYLRHHVIKDLLNKEVTSGDIQQLTHLLYYQMTQHDLVIETIGQPKLSDKSRQEKQLQVEIAWGGYGNYYRNNMIKDHPNTGNLHRRTHMLRSSSIDLNKTEYHFVIMFGIELGHSDSPKPLINGETLNRILPEFPRGIGTRHYYLSDTQVKQFEQICKIIKHIHNSQNLELAKIEKEFIKNLILQASHTKRIDIIDTFIDEINALEQ